MSQMVYTPEETRVQIQRALRRRFFGTAFEVTLYESQSGRHYVWVAWDDGPSEDQVGEVCAKYKPEQEKGKAGKRTQRRRKRIDYGITSFDLLRYDTAAARQYALEEIEREMGATIRSYVAHGFRSRGEMVELATEEATAKSAHYSDPELPTDIWRERAEEIIEEVIGEYREAQRHWPDTTDCDRLDRAFEDLEWNGILARHEPECYDTYASVSTAAEMRDRVAAGHPIRGCVYYDEHGTGRAIEGDGLWLYHAAAQEDAAAQVVAREIVDTLERHGLTVTWSGSLDQRIHVALTWQRRLRDVEPVWDGWDEWNEWDEWDA